MAERTYPLDPVVFPRSSLPKAELNRLDLMLARKLGLIVAAFSIETAPQIGEPLEVREALAGLTLPVREKCLNVAGGRQVSVAGLEVVNVLSADKRPERIQETPLCHWFLSIALHEDPYTLLSLPKACGKLEML